MHRNTKQNYHAKVKVLEFVWNFSVFLICNLFFINSKHFTSLISLFYTGFIYTYILCKMFTF